jgi:polyisoprenoid-binding protein YceI
MVVKRYTSTLAKVLAAAALLCSESSLAALAEAGGSQVGFFAVGPGGLQIKGQTTGVAVREEAGKIQIEVPTTKLETGIDLRDRHLRDHLHAEQHPVAKLSVERSALTFPKDQLESEGNARGVFSLNGKEHPLEFSYRARLVGGTYQVQALATVDIRDHGIEVPCYLRICVKPEVKLKIKLSVRDTAG